MNVMRSCKRLYQRYFCWRSTRWYSLRRLPVTVILVFLLVSSFLLFYYAILVFHLNYCCYHSSTLIVSLTTTPSRFHYELPFTIHSLLTQTRLPREIRIYLSPTMIVSKQQNLTLKDLKVLVKAVSSLGVIGRLFDRLVQIRWEEQDYGPATKFLPIIKEFHSKSGNLSQSQTMMICDDDHYYHPYTIATLETYSNEYQHSIVGLRGWRSKRVSRPCRQNY